MILRKGGTYLVICDYIKYFKLRSEKLMELQAKNVCNCLFCHVNFGGPRVWDWVVSLRVISHKAKVMLKSVLPQRKEFLLPPPLCR